MKKNTHGKGTYVHNKQLLKRILMAKLIVFLIFLFTFDSLANTIYGQEKVSFKRTGVNLKQVIQAIEKQTTVRFIYRDDLISSSERSNVSVENQPWTDVLAPLLNNVGLAFKIVDDSNVLIRPVSPVLQKGVQIKGKVKDASGIPLAGVSILEIGTTGATSTKADGSFELNVKDENAILLFRYIGYITQELQVATDGMEIRMQEDLTSLAEVVVVGFGTQKKANLTGAVTSVDMDKVLGDRPVTSTGQALQGALPGLQVTFGSGRPGQSTELNIRGMTSINGGFPLVLVDNVPMEMDDVNPKDIENVTVLKDAAAASIYGARAAYGVILITTKKSGRNQPTQFNYSNNFTWSTPVSLPEKVSPLQFVKSLKDFGNTTNWSGQSIDKWLELLQEYEQNPTAFPEGMATVDGLKYPLAEHDMYKEVFTNGFEQLHNFSVNSGSEKISYRVSGMYANEDGVMDTNKDSYKRYNLNAFLDAQIVKGLNASVNVLYKNDNRLRPSNMNEMFYRAITHSSYVPTGDAIGLNGEPIPYATPNNYLKYENPRQDFNDDLRLFGKLKYNPLAGLNITAEYTFNKKNNNYKDSQIKNKYMNPNNFNEEYLFNNEFYIRSNSLTNYHALNVYADYSKSFGEHNTKFLIGTNQESSRQESFWTRRFDVLTPSSPSLETSSGASFSGDRYGEYAVAGYFGRINYDYKGRYLLELNGRLDGSSRFGKGARYGFFPSVSAGWNVSQESFMEPVKDILPLLKFRGSFGEIGNQVVLDKDKEQVYYPVIPFMNTNNANWIDPSTGVRYLTIAPPYLVSSTFTWEKVRTLNLGVDFALAQSRLTGSFDWFRRQTIGMLFNGADLPAVLGAAPPYQNVTDLESKGWELELIWKDKIREFGYSFGVNLSDNRATITRFNNSAALLNEYYQGKEIGEIWGYVTDRFYTVDDFVEGSLDENLMNGKLKEGIPSFFGVNQNPGDVKLMDLNGDGRIFSGTGTINDPGDMKIIGNNHRRYQFGVTGNFDYKGLDLSIFVQGVGKRDLWLSNQLMWPYSDQFSTLYEHNLDYWTPSNTTSYYGRVYANSGTNSSANRRVQTKYLSDGSYLRVKNITLGYTIPQAITKGKFINRARVYISGENPFMFDKLPKGVEADAEIVSAGGVYPFLAKYSFGISLTL